MPGRLLMEAQELVGLEGLKQDRNYDTPNETGSRGDGGGSAPSAHNSHGPDIGDGQKLDIATGPTAPVKYSGAEQTFNAQEKHTLPEQDGKRLPPELEHWIESYVPFGKLLERMAQQTYFDLNETIDAMADIKVEHQPVMTNGAGVQANPDTSPASVDKKLRLMNFAQTHKDRFIKALVLSDWGRNMDQMNRLIELTMWLRQQDDMTQAAADGIMRLKHNMIGAKMPNPNIEGALELLSTGRAPWMPDLGYMPPTPLTAERLLQTLQDMNFTLSTRLNLHEELPPLMNEYIIANGRATFTVPGEFEVDLATADAEPESPFYFIDIRLLFTPTTSFANDRLRTQLESKVNQTLADRGLRGCYDFLHGFILTHKLNVLRAQSLELVRGRWSDSVSVQQIHRSIILHYWTSQPGAKNWIELGIVSGKQQAGPSGKGGSSPRLACRWFRRGKEDPDHQLDFDFVDLSIERILRTVLTTHINGRLMAISDRFARLSADSSAVSQQLHKSGYPIKSRLTLSLKPGLDQFTVTVQAITGEWIIAPQSAVTAPVQAQINTSTDADVALAVQRMLCISVRDTLRTAAHRLAWVTSARLEATAIKSLAVPEPVCYTVFERPSWGRNLAIVVTIDLRGLQWWVLKRADPQNWSGPSETLRRLETDAVSADMRGLSSLERSFVDQISLSSLKEQLGRSSIPVISRSPTGMQGRRYHEPAIFVDADKVCGWRSSRNIAALPSPWCTGLVRITSRGLDDDRSAAAGVVFTLKGAFSSTAARAMLPHMPKMPMDGSDFLFHDSGAFDVVVKTALAGSLLPQMRAKVMNLWRLCSYVEVALRHHFRVTKAGPGGMEFCYASQPKLLAELHFPEELSGKCDVVLAFTAEAHGSDVSHRNPHCRAQEALQRKLNLAALSQTLNPRNCRRNFEEFCQVLRFTLPPLQVLTRLESADPYMRAIFHCHSATSFRLTYRPPLSKQVFDIVAKRHQGRGVWLVQSGQKQRLPLTETGQALQVIWDGSGKGWKGLRNGAIAEATGIGDLLTQLDTVVRHAKDESGAETTEEASAQKGLSSKAQKKGRKGSAPGVILLD